LSFLLDTDVAIHLRDLNDAFLSRLGALDEMPALSVITLVELEGGIHAAPKHGQARRVRVDAMVREMPVLPFDEPCVAAYGRIVAAAGYSRRKVVDRMIAATALAHGLTLITLNGADFQDIHDLDLIAWTSAA
jgi:predicted nucleic acid-binding protein